MTRALQGFPVASRKLAQTVGMPGQFLGAAIVEILFRRPAAGSILFLIPSRPGHQQRRQSQIGVRRRIGERASTPLAFGLSTQGIRHAARAGLRAEWARSTGGLRQPGIRRL